MQKVFIYNDVLGQIELNIPEITLVNEFKALLDNKRNVCKEDKTGKQHLRAFKEFTYIWLALDWLSFYSDYSELDRHYEALKDSGLTETQFNDPTFRAACRKYRELQNSTTSIRALKSAQNMINKFIDYFNNVDPEERDVQTGKPIFKVKDMMVEVAQLDKLLKELKQLEDSVKHEVFETSKIRGGVMEGFDPDV